MHYLYTHKHGFYVTFCHTPLSKNSSSKCYIIDIMLNNIQKEKGDTYYSVLTPLLDGSFV